MESKCGTSRLNIFISACFAHSVFKEKHYFVLFSVEGSCQLFVPETILATFIFFPSCEHHKSSDEYFVPMKLGG